MERPHVNKIVMLGTSEATQGGIAEVIKNYRQNGLFDRWPIHCIATHREGHWPSKLATAINAFTRFLLLLALRRVALVHVHSASKASFWRKSVFIASARIAGRPVILHLHGGGFQAFYDRCDPLRRLIVRRILRMASCIVVVSKRWERYVGSLCNHRYVTTIHNPIDTRALLGIERGCRSIAHILFLGRLDPRKGVYELLDAIAIMRLQIPVVLTIAGDGDRRDIQARINALRLADVVEFTGWVVGSEKTKVYADACVYVLPSYAEGLPLAIIEAMAAGLPIVATNVGGIPDVVEDGVNGILVKPRDVTSLAAALIALLRDPELRRKMGQFSRQRVLTEFDPGCVISQVESLYRELGVDRNKRDCAYSDEVGQIVRNGEGQ